MPWGAANSESAMNYYHHLIEMAVHELDVALVNDFYDYNRSSFGRFPIDVVWQTTGPVEYGGLEV